MIYLFEFIQRWLGSLSGVIITFAGFLFCALAVAGYWHRRVSLPAFLWWLCCGLMVALYPVFGNYYIRILPSNMIIPNTVFVGLFFVAVSLIVFSKSNNRTQDDLASTAVAKGSLFVNETPRDIRGTSLGAPLVIFLGVLAVFLTGLSTPQVMVGDEVTHYYMLTHQADDLTQPNFFAKIPVASGGFETRRYPHSFVWHYIGALLYHFSGGSFLAIQAYQAFFLFQLLTAAYLLARDRQGVESRSALAYVLVLASLPLCLIFSVTFYQDVPLTAQVVTAFFLLRRGRWLLASLFMGLAIGLKVTAVLFFPSFFFMVLYWQSRRSGLQKGIGACLCTILVVLGCTWGIGRAIVFYGNSEFYPQAQMERLLKKTQEMLINHIPVVSEKIGVANLNTNLSARPNISQKIQETMPEIIANHPGDLRVKENYLVYGGIIIWLIVLHGLMGKVFYRLSPTCLIAYREKSYWLYLVGGSFTLLTAWFIKTSPDARFFLPGLPFLLLPLVEKVVCLPKPKVLIAILAALAFLQGSYVLRETHKLRKLSPELQEGISYLQEHPSKRNIFMYPEGNYRFFPARPEWYLGYRLRDFWRAENDERIEILHRFGIGAVVVKKHLIAPVDEEITNLGVYPVKFVDDLRHDSRFLNSFENDKLVIFTVPGALDAEK